MIDHLAKELTPTIDFNTIKRIETIQSLWSGYGSLLKVHLEASLYHSVIVKRITPPNTTHHPRGWNSNFSHQRKLRSYEVETNWYKDYSHRVNAHSRIPALLGEREIEGGTLLVLEDLDGAGYHLRKSDLGSEELKKCLTWLASFHAQFMGISPGGLWEIGTYWQLDTRPEEWESMPEGPLKKQARALHDALTQCQYRTIVHGDAKYANFCFSESGEVAAVDFQYVGGGCGMRDVAYLLSCVPGGLSHEMEKELLAHYFGVLQEALDPHLDFSAIEKEWRRLYPVAWADFERFLQGWAPGHWKSSSYSAQQVERALQVLRTS